MSQTRNFKQIKAIEYQNKKRFLAVNPNLNESAGIYILTRDDEEGFKYAYVGQAKHVVTRLAQHMTGYQHIDLSLKKHGLYSKDNPYGWKVGFFNCKEEELDQFEQQYIKEFAKNRQMLNKTSGSQGAGKKQIAEYRPSKGYRDGIEQGRKNVGKELAHLFELHLEVKTKKDPPTVNQQKALEKFKEILEYGREKDVCQDNN